MTINESRRCLMTGRNTAPYALFTKAGFFGEFYENKLSVECNPYRSNQMPRDGADIGNQLIKAMFAQTLCSGELFKHIYV